MKTLPLFLFLLTAFVFAQTSELTVTLSPTGNDSFELAFPTEATSTYIIYHSPDLVSYAEVERVPGTGEPAALSYSIDGAEPAFYRVDTAEVVTEVNLPTGMTFVSIPAGSFTMGDASILGPLASAHQPERTVNISAFQMAEAEVTNAQYVEFLNAAMTAGLIEVADEVAQTTDTYVYGAEGQTYAGQKFIHLSGSRVLKDHDGDGVIDPENPLNRCWINYDESTQTFSLLDPTTVDWDAFVYEDGESRADWPELAEGSLPTLAEIEQWPVNFIKWYGAHVFAQFYDCDLPTEAEWEYAAKGGQGLEFATADGTIDNTTANYNELDAHPDTGHVLPVKSYAPNPFGMYDMSGNVWEWCRDWYDPDFYANSPDPDTDPVNDALVVETTEPVEGDSYTGGPGQSYNGDTRVRRGGSWNYHESAQATANRERDFTWRGNDHFGFRIVKR